MTLPNQNIKIYYDTFKDILGGDLQTAKVKSKQMTTFANVAMFYWKLYL